MRFTELVRFFYADERSADGVPKYHGTDGPSHAEFYARLASHQGDIPWLVTFANGSYAKF